MLGAKELVQIPSGHSFRVLRWKSNLREVECVIDEGKSVPITGEGAHWHFHKEMELTLFLTGEGTRFVGDHIAFFQAGDLVLLGENLPHYWHTRGDCSGVSIQWHFPVSHPFWAFPENSVLDAFFQKAGRGLHIKGQTAQIVSRMLQELPERVGHAQLALMLHVITTIATAPAADKSFLSLRSFNLASEDQQQAAIARAVQHMIANFRYEIRLEDVMLAADMSRATFARRFKALTGHTFSEFLNKLRLQAAKRELRETPRSVVDIAFASGFHQLSFFNRIFRRHEQCSPSQYRKAQKTSGNPARNL